MHYSVVLSRFSVLLRWWRMFLHLHNPAESSQNRRQFPQPEHNQENRSKSLSRTSSTRINTSMNTEAMPLKHEHCHQPPCGATPPMEEEAVPFPATTATTKTRVTRAALVLCVVAAVVYCKLVKPQVRFCLVNGVSQPQQMHKRT